MNTPLIADIQAWIAQHNDAEIVRNREYYHALCTVTPQRESFDVRMTGIGRFATTGAAATDPEINALRRRISVPLPEQLALFLRQIGGLSTDTIQFFSAWQLLENFNNLPTRPSASRSIGIIDMIHRRWGSHRWELDPKNGLIDQSDVDLLNQAYPCIGWFLTEDEESATYVYFDQEGKFGTLAYHQGAIETLLDEDLPQLLKGSGAQHTLSQVVHEALNAARNLLGKRGTSSTDDQLSVNR